MRAGRREQHPWFARGGSAERAPLHRRPGTSASRHFTAMPTRSLHARGAVALGDTSGYPNSASMPAACSGARRPSPAAATAGGRMRMRGATERAASTDLREWAGRWRATCRVRRIRERRRAPLRRDAAAQACACTTVARSGRGYLPDGRPTGSYSGSVSSASRPFPPRVTGESRFNAPCPGRSNPKTRK